MMLSIQLLILLQCGKKWRHRWKSSMFLRLSISKLAGGKIGSTRIRQVRLHKKRICGYWNKMGKIMWRLVARLAILMIKTTRRCLVMTSRKERKVTVTTERNKISQLSTCQQKTTAQTFKLQINKLNDQRAQRSYLTLNWSRRVVRLM